MNEKNEGSTALPLMFGGIFLFLVILIIIFEVQNVYSVKRMVTKELDRAANIAIITAVEDDYRIDGISRLDTVLVEDEFYDYTREVLDLDYSLQHDYDNVEYILIIDDMRFADTPPTIEVDAIIHLKPIFLQGIIEKYLGTDVYFDIPISVKSKNQRMD